VIFSFYFFVPASAIPEILVACGQKAIKRVMLQSAGFGEAGDKGRRLQDQCLEIKPGVRALSLMIDEFRRKSWSILVQGV